MDHNNHFTTVTNRQSVVFAVFFGLSNARALASGVSRATIPTMVGMVAALSGFILSHQLDKRTKNEAELIAEHLTPSHDGSVMTVE